MDHARPKTLLTQGLIGTVVPLAAVVLMILFQRSLLPTQPRPRALVTLVVCIAALLTQGFSLLRLNASEKLHPRGLPHWVALAFSALGWLLLVVYGGLALLAFAGYLQPGNKLFQ